MAGPEHVPAGLLRMSIGGEPIEELRPVGQLTDQQQHRVAGALPSNDDVRAVVRR